jgi:Concanavalin A-like lectin/glucanases superfamily
MVKLFQLIGPIIVLSEVVLEYRFGLNFGQVFYDFSNNKNYAVNGINSSVDSLDTTVTDRGIYMDPNYCNYGITLPANDQTSSISLSSTFSIISWVLSIDWANDIHFNAQNSVNGDYVMLYIDSGNNLVDVNSQNLGVVYSFQSKSGSFIVGNIYKGQWELITLTCVGSSMSIYINGILSASLTLASSIALNSNYNYYIGSIYTGCSYGGFTWNLIILDSFNDQTQYYLDSSSVCLLAGDCQTPCTPSINDTILGAGCLSIVTDPSTDSSGVSCPTNCNGPCTSSVCLSYTLNSSTTKCPSGYFALPTVAGSCLSMNNICGNYNLKVLNPLVTSPAINFYKNCSCPISFYMQNRSSEYSYCILCYLIL